MTSRAASKRRAPSKRARAAPPEATAPSDRTETQRRLLDAAVGLFAERGYDGVTTAEIAARAKVAEKTLFANFGTKERLYQEALQPATLWASMVPEAMRTLAPVFLDAPEDPRALLRALLTNRIAFARTHRREVKMLAQHLLLRPEAVRAMTEAWSEKLAPLFLPTLARLTAAGAVRADVPSMSLIRFIATAAVGYVLSSVVLRPDLDWDDAREVEHLVDMIAGGIAPKR
jgi:AcrR family transcriptional regulator